MKRSELAEYIKETIVDVLSEDTAKELEDTKELTQAVKDLQKAKEEAGLSEDIDDAEKAEKEVTIDPNDSVTKISSELQKNATAMKTVLNKWKKAEGEEKERLFNRLKELTKIKNELEGLL